LTYKWVVGFRGELDFRPLKRKSGKGRASLVIKKRALLVVREAMGDNRK